MKNNKYLIILILLFYSNYNNAQTDNNENFKIVENELIWQKIFPMQVEYKIYYDNLKTNEFLNSLTENSNSISGKSNKKDLKIKSPYWASFPFDCFIKIEFKDDKLRVSISNITFDGPEIEIYGVSDKLDYKLSTAAQKNGEMKNSKKVQEVISTLDKFFNDTMNPNIAESKDNW